MGCLAVVGLLRECLGHVVLVIDAARRAPSISAQLQQERLVLATALVLLRLPFVLVLNKWDKRFRPGEACDGALYEASSTGASSKSRKSPNTSESPDALWASSREGKNPSGDCGSKYIDGTEDPRNKRSELSEGLADGKAESTEKRDRERMAEEVLQALIVMLSPAARAIAPLGPPPPFITLEAEVSSTTMSPYQEGEKAARLSEAQEAEGGSPVPARQGIGQKAAVPPVCARPQRGVGTDAQQHQASCPGQPTWGERAGTVSWTETNTREQSVSSQGGVGPRSARRNPKASIDARTSCSRSVTGELEDRNDLGASQNKARGGSGTREGPRKEDQTLKEEGKSVRIHGKDTGWEDAKKTPLEYTEWPGRTRNASSDQEPLLEAVQRDFLNRKVSCRANFQALLRTCVVGDGPRDKRASPPLACATSESLRPERCEPEKDGSFLRCGGVFSVSCVDGRGIAELGRYLQVRSVRGCASVR